MPFGKFYFLPFLLFCLGAVAVITSAHAQNDYRVPFRHRVGNPAPHNNIFHLRGDFTVIGNTNLTLESYRDDVQNALEKMKFVDIDSDPETFNSSSATLMFSEENGADPNCTEVIYAGLYWSGRTKQGQGLTFETTKKGDLGTPITLDKKESVISPFEELDYFPYTFNVHYAYDMNGEYFPIYDLNSADGQQTISFTFSYDGQVQYSLDFMGGYTPVEDLKILHSNGKSTATFKPVTFSANGFTFSVTELTRATESVIEEDGLKDNAIKLLASGTYTPYLYQTKEFDKRKVKLKAPGATTYTEITAAGNAILYPEVELGEMYVGYADVTQLVQNRGSGKYTIADIALTEGQSDNTGFYGHWGLIVIYQNSTMNMRDVTIFDGYTFVEAQNGVQTVGEIEIKGFGTVKDGPVNLKLGIMAGEGDKPTLGDFLEIMDQKGNWIPLHHPKNSTDNFFNSSIYTPIRKADGGLIEPSRSPILSNNTGIDIVQWDIPNPNNSIIANNQTSARFRYGTNQDLFTLYALAFSILSYSPEIHAHNQIKSIDGEIPPDSPTVKPGEEIIYQLDIRNVGSESSESTKIIIPIPYTATFVDAKVIPSAYGQVTFDPSIGLSGAIIWDLGTVPVTANPEELIASLEYTLKLTEDCFVLANDNCDARISVNGTISGIGGTTKQAYSDIPFVKEFMGGECTGYGVYGDLDIPIAGKAEFAASHCLGYELFTGLGPIDLPEFCQGDPPAELSEYIKPSAEGLQVYFFSSEIGGTPILEYYVNTSQIGTERIWVSEGPAGSCTGLRIPVDLAVTPRTPQPYTEDKSFCMEDNSFLFTVDSSPEFTVLYYKDNDPTTTPMVGEPTIDMSKPGEFSIWVSQFKDGECESFRKEVKFISEDCSLRPNIQLFLTADRDSFTKEMEIITFTIVVKNSGGVKLELVWLNEYLNYDNWNIPSLEPFEERAYTITYTTTAHDMYQGAIYLNAETGGLASNGENVYDNKTIELPGYISPPGFLDYSLTYSSERCQPLGIDSGYIGLKWQQSQSGTYSIISLIDGTEYKGEFENKTQIQHEVPVGSYSISISDPQGNTQLVQQEVIIEKMEYVDFQVPDQVEACGEYLLYPKTDLNLNYTLLAPDATKVVPHSDGYFTINQSGIYRITGRDSQGKLCQLEKSFQATISLPSPLELEALPFCSEDTSTTVFLRSEIGQNDIKWFKLGPQGYLHLRDFDNNPILSDQEAGEYRITLSDSDGCNVGIGQIQLSPSNTSPVELSGIYTICPTKNNIPVIEPGSRFKEFSWILEGVEISNASTFSPSREGSYSLVAKDIQGCAFFADFQVEVKCQPEVRYPTAIRPGDPERIFEIYPDNLTDELEVSILNRWGQLIFYCEDVNLKNGVKSSCVWDGRFNDIGVQNGSYLVLLRIKNHKQNMTIVQRSSVLVID
ncbi:gliding motility-associated C-terminal domain-containing protein [Algoriphagus sp. AGSA1]|uniref:gliding motility-associated C-terminal domain-containing protein n=1 Tax=Algoriphagus sp. AGSA1 TaxID=2907213 RepID=UPI001F2DA012|nr:gliding motility-associated C-terminal domain-containing protein [Algoriphagus sp. AGSA1]MCE7055589.1 gliding motility-associated C-terminal domain-containing protein [Algoriphagus sp. AGSA1]